MKKLFRNEGILLSGIAMTCFLLISACEQESNSPANPVDDGEILSNAGELHNQMISYYYDHRTEQMATPEGMYSEVLGLSAEYLVSAGYDASSIEKARLAVENNYTPACLKASSEGKASLDPETFIPQLRATGLYSENLLDAIDEILQMAEEKTDKKTIRKHVNSVFTGIHFSHLKDREAQKLFVNIFNASYKFWESYYATNLKDAQLKKSSWVIINDGIGGLLGSIFGPAGSIITATVFSVGTNEEING